MSIDDKIAELEVLVGKLETVKTGDFVLASQNNLFVDFSVKLLDVVKELYDLFKEKTGSSLPVVEYYIGMAESRINLMESRKFGDLVLPTDHNLAIDSWKALEMALHFMDEALG